MSVAISKAVTYISVPMAASAVFIAGEIVCLNTAGHAATPADTSGFIYYGTAGQDVDNTGGAAAAKEIPVWPASEINRYLVMTLTGAVQADIGEQAYITGRNSVSKSAGNGVKMGMILDLVGTDLVLIDTGRNVA